MARNGRAAGIAGLAAVLAFAIAGCGVFGGSDDDTASSDQESSTPAANVPTGVVVPPTQGQEVTSLHASDFVLSASGLTGFADSGDSSGGTGGASEITKLATCLSATSLPTPLDKAESTHLVNQSTGVTVWSDAQVMPSGTLTKDTELLSSPNFASCALEGAKDEGIATLQAANGTLLAPEANALETSAPSGALARTTFVVLAGLESGGQAQLFYDTVYLGSGQVEAQIHLLGTTEPPGDDVVNAAVQQVLTKLNQQ